MRHFVVIYAVFFLTSGCALWGNRPDSVSTAPALSIGESVPFKLEILDEVNDGELLHVIGAITAETSWKLSDVTVKLTGIKDGQVSGVSLLPLHDTIKDDQSASETIRAHERFQFSLSVPSKDLSDYQVEALWGEELTGTGGGRHGKGTLEIRELEIETHEIPCAISTCDVRYNVFGKLFNLGSSTIDRAVLGVGYVDPAQAVPEGAPFENEQQIEIPGLILSPGEARAFKLDLDRAVPQSSKARPRIRIVSYHTVAN